MTEFKSIRLADILYSKLNYLRGKKSFPAYIESMVKYFELTGINPDSIQMPMIQEYKKETERVVKILRAMEKDTFRPIKILLEGSNLNQNSLPGITGDDVVKMVNVNENLSSELERLKGEKVELLQKVRNLKMQVDDKPKPSSMGIDTEELLMLINGLDEMASEGTSRDILVRKEALYDIANRMKNCLSNVCKDSYPA